MSKQSDGTAFWCNNSSAVAAAGGVLLALVACLPALTGEFFGDDFVYVVGNRSLAEIPLARPWRAFLGGTNPLEYLPVRDLSYRLDLVWADGPAAFRLHNMALYAAACWAVWYASGTVLDLLVPPIDDAAPPGWRSRSRTGATLLFALHPAHVESVAWVSGRKEVLSGFLSILALGLFVSALRRERGRAPRAAAACTCFALAVLSKAAVLPLAALVALLCLRAGVRDFHGSRGIRRGLLVAAPILAVAVGGVVLAVAVGRDTGVTFDAVRGEVAARAGRARTAVHIQGYLARILLLPAGLRLVYPWVREAATVWWAVGLGAATWMGALWGCVALVRRGSTGAFALAGFGLLTLPFLQLVPFRTWSLASERFLFLAMFPPCLGGAAWLARRPRLGWATLVILSVAGGLLTVDRARAWGDTPGLVLETARRAPNNYKAVSMAVDLLLDSGGRENEARSLARGVGRPLEREVLLATIESRRAVAAGDWESATRWGTWLGNAVGRRSPPEVLHLVGLLAERRGDDVEAARSFHMARERSWVEVLRARADTALRGVRARHRDRLAALATAAAAPDAPIEAVGALANLRMELFLLDEAAAGYRAILARHPTHPVALYNLGLTQLRMGRPAEAVRNLQAAIHGGMATAGAWNNLGLAHKESGDFDGAAAAFQAALDQDLDHWHAALNLGRMRVQLGQKEAGAAALREARRRAVATDGPVKLVDLYLQDVTGL